ncbi:MAG: hypothetical protein ACT4QF_08715 [Sporichthyaceae bacterium]
MKRAALVLVAALSTATLAACGGSGDTAAQTTPAVEQVAPADAELAAPAKEALAVAGGGLASATADANRIAPKLEQYYFAKGYPTDLKGAKASMKPAGQKVSKGNTLAGYSFDKADEEFIICIQNSSGAWATYDTAPMAAGANGESGGCPKDLRAPGGGGHSGH